MSQAKILPDSKKRPPTWAAITKSIETDSGIFGPGRLLPDRPPPVKREGERKNLLIIFLTMVRIS